jgi:two-component system cell cycle response regulator DivK
MPTQPRILYVEDNEDNVAMLKDRLEIEGFEVLVATDGISGVECVRRQRPDLVLMDLDLPDIDGWEATRRIRGDASTRSIPVIALSAHAMPEHQAQATRAGCDHYETKPVDFARLVVAIRELLSKS